MLEEVRPINGAPAFRLAEAFSRRTKSRPPLRRRRRHLGKHAILAVVRATRNPRGSGQEKVLILWRPFLRAVDDVCDFHNVLADPIDNHERKGWQRKFTRPFHTALATLVGKRLQRTSTVVDGLGYALSGGRIFLPDVFDNSEKVFSGGGCQRSCIYLRNISSIRSTTSSCVRNSPLSSCSKPLVTCWRNHASWST